MKYIILILSFFGIVACNYQSADPAYVEQLRENRTFWSWNGRQIHYLEKGTGSKHIVLLHGFAANTYTWRNQVDELVKKGFHVWALDFLGFGFSDKPQDVDYDADLYRSQVLDFMDAMHIPKAHLVGHSMGGIVALNLAGNEPRRFHSLTLIDSTGYEMELPFVFSLTKKMGKTLLPLFSRTLIHQILKQLYYDHSLITQEQIDAYWTPFKLAGSRETTLKILKMFDNQIFRDQQPTYKNIKIPTLIIFGKEDRWIPISHLELFTKDIPHAKQAVIDNCGHAPQEECPEEFNRIFLKFL
jgi:pimeloyl-ACP methyl ester carboxylesterase